MNTVYLSIMYSRKLLLLEPQKVQLVFRVVVHLHNFLRILNFYIYIILNYIFTTRKYGPYCE
jgi:hypothetical protein